MAVGSPVVARSGYFGDGHFLDLRFLPNAGGGRAPEGHVDWLRLSRRVPDKSRLADTNVFVRAGHMALAWPGLDYARSLTAVERDDNGFTWKIWQGFFGISDYRKLKATGENFLMAALLPEHQDWHSRLLAEGKLLPLERAGEDVMLNVDADDLAARIRALTRFPSGDNRLVRLIVRMLCERAISREQAVALIEAFTENTGKGYRKVKGSNGSDSSALMENLQGILARSNFASFELNWGALAKSRSLLVRDLYEAIKLVAAVDLVSGGAESQWSAIQLGSYAAEAIKRKQYDRASGYLERLSRLPTPKDESESSCLFLVGVGVQDLENLLRDLERVDKPQRERITRLLPLLAKYGSPEVAARLAGQFDQQIAIALGSGHEACPETEFVNAFVQGVFENDDGRTDKPGWTYLKAWACTLRDDDEEYTNHKGDMVVALSYFAQSLSLGLVPAGRLMQTVVGQEYIACKRSVGEWGPVIPAQLNLGQLRKISSHGHPGLPYLMEAARSPVDSVRARVLRALSGVVDVGQVRGRLEDEFVPLLEAGVNDSADSVRLAALRAIGRLAQSGQISLVQMPLFMGWVRRLLEDPRQADVVRAAAVDVYGEIAALPYFTEEERRHAGEVLAGLDLESLPEPCRFALVTGLYRGAYYDVGGPEGVKHVGVRGSESIARLLYILERDESEKIRVRAASKLGTLLVAYGGLSFLPVELNDRIVALGGDLLKRRNIGANLKLALLGLFKHYLRQDSPPQPDGAPTPGSAALAVADPGPAAAAMSSSPAASMVVDPRDTVRALVDDVKEDPSVRALALETLAQADWSTQRSHKKISDILYRLGGMSMAYDVPVEMRRAAVRLLGNYLTHDELGDKQIAWQLLELTLVSPTVAVREEAFNTLGMLAAFDSGSADKKQNTNRRLCAFDMLKKRMANPIDLPLVTKALCRAASSLVVDKRVREEIVGLVDTELFRKRQQMSEASLLALLNVIESLLAMASSLERFSRNKAFEMLKELLVMPRATPAVKARVLELLAKTATEANPFRDEAAQLIARLQF